MTELSFESLKHAFEVARGVDKRTAAANIIRYVDRHGSPAEQELREKAAALLVPRT